MDKIKVVIPTYNGGTQFAQLANSILNQKNISAKDVLIIDSSSTDDTVNIAKRCGFETIVINKSDFGHGKTRASSVERLQTDIVVFMTQDVLPEQNDSILELCKPLMDNKKIGAVYGRQIPKEGASLFSSHARLFNYGTVSRINKFDDRFKLGLKTAFLSDSFAAYNKEILMKVGNFPDVSFGEDTCVAATMLMQGYNTAYNASAAVYHSHDFTIWDEFKRYKETGIFHQNEKWLLETFGKAEGEGFRFIKSEMKYLINHHAWYMIPISFFRNFSKYLGYLLGKYSN